MPTYQYACTECGHDFEQVQKFSDDALTECPQCTGKLRKVYNAVGVVFKGSGFYRNDSRPSDTSSGSSDSTSSSGDGGSSGSGGDGKPTGTSEKSSTETKAADPKPAAKTPAPSTTGSAGS